VRYRRSARRRGHGFSLSCDNIRGNGAVARKALVSFANHQDPEIGQWIAEHVSFPNTMVDRITPVTTEEDRAALNARLGIDDARPVVCEPFRQWVVQDAFPNGRPPLEDAGVTVVHDVEAYELMKLRLLNGAHQVIGQFGRLAGISYVHDVLADPTLKRLAELYMKQEAEPTLTPIDGVSFDNYEATLIERFANLAIADTTDRLCAFTSDRIPPWIVPVLQANRDGGSQIAICTALIAAWARASSHPNDIGTEILHTDNRMSAMLEATRAVEEDPLAFVRNSQLFGDFKLDDEFEAEYLAAWDSLRTRGAIGTAASLVARLDDLQRVPPK
jgi:mannitol 2-dehydrogenase